MRKGLHRGLFLCFTQLFFPANLDVVLGFQIRVDAEPIPAVINDPLTLLLRESFDLTNLPVIGVDIVKLHLKSRMLLDEQDRFDVPILKRFVIPNVKHCHQNQNKQGSQFLHGRLYH